MTDAVPNAPQDAPKVIMMPPVLVLLHTAAGLAVNWMFNGHMAHGWGWLGLPLLGGGLALTIWAMRIFTKAGTNIPPSMPALKIVTHGPFEYSRNPMYVGFLAGFVGMALLAGAPWMLLFALPLWYILDQKVIAPEEVYLLDKFGEEYRSYTIAVRRWV